MNTEFWGPSGWVFLHTLTFIYPEKPSYNDKVKIEKFMKNVSYILPCKYCRVSFNKYAQSLPITHFLDNREKMIEWLYKIHNKVNKKLRSQGLCRHKNPDLEDVKLQYKPIIDKINSLCNTNTIKTIINYICNLGKEFLGSIVFNYQGYFSNCHTQDEKLNIVVVYHTFFNSIMPLISSYVSKISKKCHQDVSRHSIYLNTNFKLKSILIQNEAYSKLIKWFYKCNHLCTFNTKDETRTFEHYKHYFTKHIVFSCNNPLTLKNNKNRIKSCRKNTIKLTKKIKNK